MSDGQASIEPAFSPATFPPIYVDHAAKQVLSLEVEADVFYGLLPGTNGTGPAMRRGCVPADYVWLTSSCKRAWLTLVPSNTSDDLNTNPWSGRP